MYILLLVFCTLNGYRDPFVSVHAAYRYAYIAVGYVHSSNESFGVLAIDGIIYQVHKGQKVAGHEILRFTKELLVLKDEHGVEQSLPLKKIPSTRELKGQGG